MKLENRILIICAILIATIPQVRYNCVYDPTRDPYEKGVFILDFRHCFSLGEPRTNPAIDEATESIASECRCSLLVGIIATVNSVSRDVC